MKSLIIIVWLLIGIIGVYFDIKRELKKPDCIFFAWEIPLYLIFVLLGPIGFIAIAIWWYVTSNKRDLIIYRKP